jgi:carbamoyltransferase
MACWILGISALYHDSAAVLLRDGVVFAAAQEERFTRIKHDSSLPRRAVKWLLSEAGITAHDLEHVVFYEKTLRKFDRILSTSVTYFPASWRLFPLQMRAWLGDKIWLRDKLASEFDVAPERLLFAEHHMSHAASAFYASPYEDAAVLTVDGVGEWATTALWRASGGQIEPVSEIRYPHSLGLFYSAVTAHLGFVVNNGEYKVMGMASYGQPRFIDQMRSLVVNKDGGFELDLTYFCHHLHPQKATTPAFEALLGPPRHPSEPFDLDSDDPAVRASSQHWADLAASAQLRLEEVLQELVAHAHTQVPSRALCLAGGVALNAVANQKLAKGSPFERIWVQPAAGDAGGALGAALWAWHMVLGKPRTPQPAFDVALGRSWTQDTVEEFLEDFGMTWTDTGQDLALRVAEDLAEGKIVAWMQDGFEWGPRSLGYRSILADPRDPQMQDRLNRCVKFREPFRPFAPVTLESEVDAWFDIPPAAREMLPYMVCTVDVRPEVRDRIPAVTHVDGTARVQTVSERDNPRLREVIERFAERTEVPVLINTSFNVKGEPIVNSPVDAVATFLQSEMDFLYIGTLRVQQPKRRRVQLPRNAP